MKTVKVTLNPKNNQVFTLNAELGKDGKEYGFIRVEESQPRIDWSNGVARVSSPRSALKTFLKEDFDKVANLLTPGHEMPGQVIIVESTEKLGSAIQKTAGEGGEALTYRGAPIYRYTQFDDTCKKEDFILDFDQKKANVATPAVKAAAESMG